MTLKDLEIDKTAVIQSVGERKANIIVQRMECRFLDFQLNMVASSEDFSLLYTPCVAAVDSIRR